MESFTNSPVLPLVLMFAVFWLFLIRPQQKQMKKTQEMQKALKVGDQVVTQSGIFGTVASLDDQRVTLRMVDGAKIEFLRSTIAQNMADVQRDGGKK